MIWALLTGCIAGFFMAIPPGPLGVAVIARTVEQGPRNGLVVGVGGVLPEIVLASLGFWGSTYLDGIGLETPLRILGFSLVLILGIKYTFFPKSYAASRQKMSFDARDRNSFLIGFALTISNPTPVATYVIVAGIAHSGGLLVPSSLNHTFAAVGAGLGLMSWFFVAVAIVRTVTRAHGDRFVRAVGIGSGVLLLLVSIRMAWSIVQHS